MKILIGGWCKVWFGNVMWIINFGFIKLFVYIVLNIMKNI